MRPKASLNSVKERKGEKEKDEGGVKDTDVWAIL